jgi:hypothetical protein
MPGHDALAQSGQYAGVQVADDWLRDHSYMFSYTVLAHIKQIHYD